MDTVLSLTTTVVQTTTAVKPPVKAPERDTDFRWWYEQEVTPNTAFLLVKKIGRTEPRYGQKAKIEEQISIVPVGKKGDSSNWRRDDENAEAFDAFMENTELANNYDAAIFMAAEEPEALLRYFFDQGIVTHNSIIQAARMIQAGEQA